MKHSCYVRIEDPDKRKEVYEWLGTIGHIIHYDIEIAEDDDEYIVVTDNYSDLFDEKWIKQERKVRHIDCGTNIDYFKAIAAINDENDYMQWFVHASNGSFDLSKRESISKYPLPGRVTRLWRKATPSELEEYFNKKNNE